MELLMFVPILFPIIAGIMIKALKMTDKIKRDKFSLTVTVINAIIVVILIASTDNLEVPLLELGDKYTIFFRIDMISKVFAGLASFIWILSCAYAFEYMKHEKREENYFMFFLITLGIIIALCFSGSILTFYMFYELMTILTFPLVIHSDTEGARKAGIKYLVYSFLGASLVLAGIMILSHFGQTLDFTMGGVLNKDLAEAGRNVVLVGYVLAFVGFGGKAGMFPLHAWLPIAHPEAPAPASGILSGVITKMGVLGIIRMTYYLYGTEFVQGTWAHLLVMVLAIFTVFMGSMLAYKSTLLKRRLAYSSVSQVSYVIFGIATMTQLGLVGALLHVMFHGVIKNILFLCAGAIIYKTGKTDVSQLKGIGKEMPITMWCFTIASLALVGIPPLCGFVSKYYLAMGGLEFFAQPLGTIGAAVLLVSALLTAGYLVPIVIDAFFPGNNLDYRKLVSYEPNSLMTIPLVIFTIYTIVIGIWPMGFINFFTQIAGNLV